MAVKGVTGKYSSAWHEREATCLPPFAAVRGDCPAAWSFHDVRWRLRTRAFAGSRKGKVRLNEPSWAPRAWKPTNDTQPPAEDCAQLRRPEKRLALVIL